MTTGTGNNKATATTAAKAGPPPAAKDDNLNAMATTGTTATATAKAKAQHSNSNGIVADGEYVFPPFAKDAKDGAPRLWWLVISGQNKCNGRSRSPSGMTTKNAPLSVTTAVKDDNLSATATANSRSSAFGEG
jgi:hypothetical protein